MDTTADWCAFRLGRRPLDSFRKARALRISVCLVFCLLSVQSSVAQNAPKVSYNRDVRPILSNRCFTCHGQDSQARESELRLDKREGALSEAASGDPAIVPGKPDESELIARILSDDSSSLMPPPESGEGLTVKEVAILRNWISQGAEYERHWSFVRLPIDPSSETKTTSSASDQIDTLVLKRLKQEKLSPAPEASREALIRRVTLDLTGLPPTLEAVDRFVNDESPDAYEKLVDSLLSSPRYGEHQARFWLDLARYGDTHGMHGDFYREMWPYRDWVISAFNKNLPFDEFTIEQLAGDLLEDPTDEQLLATGFLRCHVTTNEKGVLAEEAYVRNVVDRVETVSTVWLGMTTGCAVCHDHKYDPITQKDFYSLFAFFNNGQDEAMDKNTPSPAPFLKRPSEEQAKRLADYKKQLAELIQQKDQKTSPEQYQDPFEGRTIEIVERDTIWIDDTLPSKPTQAPINAAHEWKFVSSPDHPVYSGTRSTLLSGRKVSQQMFLDATSGLLVGEGDQIFFHVYLDPKDPPQQIMLKVNSGTWEHRAFWGKDLLRRGVAGTASRWRVGDLPEPGKWVRLSVPTEKIGVQPGDTIFGIAISLPQGKANFDAVGQTTRLPKDRSHLISLRVWEALVASGRTHPDASEAVLDALNVSRERRTPKQKLTVKKHFLDHVYTRDKNLSDARRRQQQEITKQIKTIEEEIPAALIFRERKGERPAYLLTRGLYDQRDEVTPRSVPAALSSFPKNQPMDRLGFARWLVSPSHPLTARVTVNRIWQQYFGVGLVKTSEDFGFQGALPSHPGLLDMLATEFVRSGWDVKRLHKQIVMSATYRQDSKAVKEQVAKDPENRLLARGPRYRLDAEMIRDNALMTSGLLVNQVGGPSVKPYQPMDIWKAVSIPTSNTSKFKQDHGDAIYRRSVYTFWKRTAPPPSLQAFDAPTRETCVSRRSRTNTPLAALVLLNDIQYVEAARTMAERVLKHSATDESERLEYAFRLATSREPNASELGILTRTLETHRKYYSDKKQLALGLVQVGESPHDKTLDPVEHASWTVVCNILLNLSESITKN